MSWKSRCAMRARHTACLMEEAEPLRVFCHSERQKSLMMVPVVCSFKEFKDGFSSL